MGAKDGTRRVVVRRERALVLPLDMDGVRVAAAWKALGLDGEPKVSEVWGIVGQFSGATKDDAIQAYAGKPGTPDARQGEYRAPSVTAWKGGLVYEAPPQPLVVRRKVVD